MTIGTKLIITTTALNAVCFLSLLAYVYHPVAVKGSWEIPHTKTTVYFGEKPHDVSEFIIPMSQL